MRRGGHGEEQQTHKDVSNWTHGKKTRRPQAAETGFRRH